MKNKEEKEIKSRVVIFHLRLDSDYDDINQKHFKKRLIDMIDKQFNPKIIKAYQVII